MRPYISLHEKRNALRDNDWTHSALVTPQRSAQQIISSIPPGVQTALVDNAGLISKQASKYSSQCGLVVLCNYQDMIILDFTPNGAHWNDLTSPVKYFFSTGNPMTHKQLLIAAFVYGMRKAGLMGAQSEIIRNSMPRLTILILCGCSLNCIILPHTLL